MLIGSGVRLSNSNPMRQFGAAAVGTAERASWGKSGELRNFGAGWARVVGQTEKNGRPQGVRHPVAWVMPQKPGGLSARNETFVTFTTGTLNLAAGRAIVGSSSITFIVPDAALQLIVSANGSASIVFTTSGNLAGSIAASGETTITFTVPTANLGAISDLVGLTTITFSASAVIRAIGNLAGDITPFTPLSPEGLANAVWQRVIEAGFTAEEILRLLAAHAAGAGTGLEGPNPQFTGIDGVTLRIDGTYSAGTRTIDALDGG